jgi:hypothetical protein
MPSSRTSPLHQRTQFIADYLREVLSVSLITHRPSPVTHHPSPITRNPSQTYFDTIAFTR